MTRLRSVINIRPDKMAVVCFYCPDKKQADQYFEENGYEVTHDVCPNCTERYKMDSLKPTKRKPFVSTVRYA